MVSPLYLVLRLKPTLIEPTANESRFFSLEPQVPLVALESCTRIIRRVEPPARAFSILEIDPSGTISEPKILWNLETELISSLGSFWGPLVVRANTTDIPWVGVVFSTLLFTRLNLTRGEFDITILCLIVNNDLFKAKEYR